MFRHDGIFELVVEGAFGSGNWRGRAWSDGCSQDWIETHTEEEVRSVLYIRVVQMRFPSAFVRIHPTIGYDTTFASVRGNISDTARVADAPSKHRIVVRTKSG
jgi:hypothetical protein